MLKARERTPLDHATVGVESYSAGQAERGIPRGVGRAIGELGKSQNVVTA